MRPHIPCVRLHAANVCKQLLALGSKVTGHIGDANGIAEVTPPRPGGHSEQLRSLVVPQAQEVHDEHFPHWSSHLQV